MTITFSQCFPTYHPRKGESTFFVEQILNQLEVKYGHISYWELLIILNKDSIRSGKLPLATLSEFYHRLNGGIASCKLHTIRSKNRFSIGNVFSPRVWSGKPYNSPQIIFYCDIEIKSTPTFTTDKWGSIYVDGKHIPYYGGIAANDGLYPVDFLDWFKIKHGDCNSNPVFDGQIIIFGDVTY